MWSGYRRFYLFSILSLSGVLLGDDGPQVVNKWNCFLLFGHTFRLAVLKIVMGDYFLPPFNDYPKCFISFPGWVNCKQIAKLFLVFDHQIIPFLGTGHVGVTEKWNIKPGMNWKEHNAPYFWDEEKDTQIVQVTCLRPPSKKQGKNSIANISTTISGFLSAHLYVSLNPGKSFLNPEECSRGARTVAVGAPYWPMFPVIRSFRFEFKCSRCHQLLSFYSTYLEKEFWIKYGNAFKLICITMHNNITRHAPRRGDRELQ